MVVETFRTWPRLLTPDAAVAGDEVNDKWVKAANERLAKTATKKSPVSARTKGKQPEMVHPRRGAPPNPSAPFAHM